MHHKMPFGADYTPDRTVFRLWAPRAVQVLLQRFCTGSDEEPGARFLGEVAMRPAEEGCFAYTVPGNLKNQYYQFLITDCTGVVTWSADPWAVACGVNGKRSMVVDLASTDPSGWAEDRGPELPKQAPVVWETHVRDFSGDPHSGVSPRNQEKYLAFTEGDTTLDGRGDFPTCMNYLKGLGVTHIQLQPFFDYCTVDERQPWMGYNWGYDPENYNVPEGSYSSDPWHGAVRIRECKKMIQAIHQAGLGVIMDVVYNHTCRPDSWLERTAPGIYYRWKKDGTPGNASGCGNETASDRAKFREYMVESVCFWAEEYHIDGFRFDLMGVHDVDTMNLIRQRLDALPGGERILTYGEPWAAEPVSMRQGAVPADKEAIELLDSRIGIFCDDTRNLLAGSPFEAHEKGYGSGNPSDGLTRMLMDAVHGWCDPGRRGYVTRPGQVLQYASCHDNYALWDRLVLQQDREDYDEPEELRLERSRFIAGIYLTLPGVGFFQSGEEFGRTKRGDGNSYCGPAQLNWLDWRRAERYAPLVDWYRGLLALRTELMPRQMLEAEPVRKIPFLTAPDNCVGFRLEHGRRWRSLLVYYNPYEEERPVELPVGRWKVLCDGVRSDLWRSRRRGIRERMNLRPLSVTILGKMK